MCRSMLGYMLLVAGGLTAESLSATEAGGLAIYPDGMENFMGGAMPGPGMHIVTFGGVMNYDVLRGDQGQSLLADFNVDVRVIAPRFIWVTPRKVAGGQLAVHMITPMLDIDFRANGGRFKSSGLGDITLGAGLGYHKSDAFHYVLAVDVFAPTGDYSANDPSSLGKNYWTIQPLVALTYTQPRGINADLKLMYDINLRNDDTNTRSGQAIHGDYTVGWGLGNNWVLGVGGHAFQQLRDDNGPNSAIGKARSFGAGPSVRYANPQGWLFTLKWQQEFSVRNRPEGEQFYAKLVVPF